VPVRPSAPSVEGQADRIDRQRPVLGVPTVLVETVVGEVTVIVIAQARQGLEPVSGLIVTGIETNRAALREVAKRVGSKRLAPRRAAVGALCAGQVIVTKLANLIIYRVERIANHQLDQGASRRLLALAARSQVSKPRETRARAASFRLTPMRGPKLIPRVPSDQRQAHHNKHVGPCEHNRKEEQQRSQSIVAAREFQRLFPLNTAIISAPSTYTILLFR